MLPANRLHLSVEREGDCQKQSDPCIEPRIFFVRFVRNSIFGRNNEDIALRKRIFLALDQKSSLSGIDVMDQPVTPVTGTGIVARLTCFIAKPNRMYIGLILRENPFLVIHENTTERQKMINLYHNLPFHFYTCQ